MNAFRSLPTRWLPILLLLLATCAHRPAVEPTLVEVAPDRRAPIAADRVLAGERGAYVLGKGGGFAAAFPEGPRGEGGAASWIDAAEIDALEGGGRWTLGLDAAGTIHRLRGGGGLEPMNARLGVPMRARHIQAAGNALAVLTDEGVFVVDAVKVTRLDLRGRELAASRSAVAVLDEDAVRWVDLETKRSRSFAVEEARRIALTHSGVLVVLTERAIYRENGSGELTRRYLADDELGALAIEGERVWFADGRRLGALDESGARLTGELGSLPITEIAASANEVWFVEGPNARRLTRTATDAFPPDVARIAQAACVPCHQPTRVAGGGPFDLSNGPAFRSRRNEVIRALTKSEMPPPGRPLSNADRARLIEWANAR